jgi:hypothetical protein
MQLILVDGMKPISGHASKYFIGLTALFGSGVSVLLYDCDVKHAKRKLPVLLGTQRTTANFESDTREEGTFVSGDSFWFNCNTEVGNTAPEGRSGWIYFDHCSALVSFC